MDWVALARSRHTAQALFIALMLGGFVVWWKVAGDPGPVESVREVAGVVEVVHDKALTIRLESGQQVRVFRNGDLAVGAPVRLTVTRHTKGDETYVMVDTRGY